jgi:hypothetical protein
VLSDIKTGEELANIIGNAVGQNINWVVFSDEDQRNGLLQAGLAKTHADAFTEMGTAMRNGKMWEEVRELTPAPGAITFEQFMPEFKRAFDAS